MKTFSVKIFIVALLLIFNESKAQNDLLSMLPEKVLISFRDRYPDVTGVTWSRDQDMFVAEYQLLKTEHQLWVSDKGKIVKHAVVIHEEQLPIDVRQQLFKSFPECRIISIYQLDIRGKNYYEMKVRHSRQTKSFLCDEHGKKVNAKWNIS